MQLQLLIEAGYGRVYKFDYEKAKTDPKPRMLLLGKWRHPDTRNVLLAGVNLNYLDDEQVAQLRQVLPQILAPRNLKSRYWKGRDLAPEIFEKSYRTYDRDWVGSVTRDTLKYYPTPEELEKAEAPKPKVPPVEPKVPAAPPEAPPEAAPAVAPPEAVAPAEAPPADVPEVPPAAPEAPPAAPEAPPAAEVPAETPPGAAPEPKKKPKKKPGASSVQRRDKAKKIKKGVEQQKLTQPPVKPPPPPEMRGALGMFKDEKR
jgi:hypothetical protein